MSEEFIGPYRVEEVLGSGGMGTVYAAWDERLERRVAIKSIHPDRELSDERRERLVREAKAAAGISHAAVAQVHDIITKDERLYIVMELVEGRSLGSMLSHEPLPLETVLDVGRQIAEGLAAAHAKDVLHRDLKAENVMVSDSGQVKILDFGLAKRLDRSETEHRLTDEGMVVGTCHAMSPEQAEGRELDHRSDLFALGSLLYRMLTAQHPFSTASPLATLRRVVAHSPEPVTSLNPAVPEQLERLVERLLEKKHERRPASAGVVADALGVMLDRSRATGETAAMMRPGRLGHRRRRHRRLLATVAALVLVALAVTALVLWRTWPRTPLAVAVLMPEVVAPEGGDGGLAGRAVREALLYSVTGLEGLAAILPDAVDQVEGTPADKARAVAADELIAATVEPGGAATRVSLRRLSGTDGAVVWTSGVFEVPAANLRLLADTVAANLRRGFPEHGPRSGAFTSEASPEDYARYLEVSRQLDDPPPGVSKESLIDLLADIRESSPGLLEAYEREVNASRYLYETTRRAEYLDRAWNVAQAAQSLAGNDPRAVVPLIEVAISAGELERAEDALDRLRRVDPANQDVLGFRARLRRAQGRDQEALTAFSELAVTRPSWKNLARLAEHQLRLGMVEDARASLHTGLDRAPQVPYLKSKLAQLELSHGAVERAEELYNDLVRQTENPVYLVNLGSARLLLGRYGEASSAYRRALALAPDHPFMLLNLADCHWLQGREQQAIELYERALVELGTGESTHDAWDLSARAVCLAHLHRGVVAVESISAALRAAPDDPLVAYDAAVVYALLGETSSALVQAGRALDGDMHPLWFELAWFDELRLDEAFAARLAAEIDKISR